MQYVIIFEEPWIGFEECIGVFDNEAEAYGTAYLRLSDGVDGREDNYYIDLPVRNEAETGMILVRRNKAAGEEQCRATVYICREEWD